MNVIPLIQVMAIFSIYLEYNQETHANLKTKIICNKHLVSLITLKIKF